MKRGPHVPWHRRLGTRWKIQLLFLLAAAVGLMGCPNGPPPPVDGGPPPAAAAEGLHVEIERVTIPSDGRPVVTFTAVDDLGNTAPLKEITTAQFILTRLEEAPRSGGATRFISYTTRIETDQATGAEAVQATYDEAGLNGLEQNPGGSFTYKFAAALPVDYDASQTHRVAGQFRRINQTTGIAYPANAVETFRPDGAVVAETRQVVNTETCNTCHTRLSEHGDIRRDVRLCTQCHNTQSGDAQSGNTVDFAEMIHKIHRGQDLPSVQQGDPYFIVGFRNTVYDYSTVAFPQDIRNCTVCHTDAPHADVYLNQPTKAGCVSCHDRTWFGAPNERPEGYTMHTGGQHVDDNLCSLCHTPTAPGPSPILEAHMIPTKSPQAPGLSFAITGVNVLPGGEMGDSLEIVFDATDKDGALYADLSELNAVAATLAYPAPEYEAFIREPIVGGGGPRGTLTSNADGSFSYIFAAALPDLPPGESLAVAMDGRVSFSFAGQNFNQGTDSNAQTFFTLDGGAPTPRRTVVDEQKCNQCHDEIRAHGLSRVGVNLCVMCHNVNTTDVARRPGDAMPPETINFKDLIHRIHRGEDLDTEYTVYGFGNVPHDFTKVRFPGRLESCSICHTGGSEQLPLPDEALSTLVTFDNEIIREVLPERAACTSCHDNLMVNVHALLNTQGREESCAVCHGAGSSFAVDAVHRLGP